MSTLVDVAPPLPPVPEPGEPHGGIMDGQTRSVVHLSDLSPSRGAFAALRALLRF